MMSENNEQKYEITKEVKIMFGQCGYDGKLHLEQVMQYCADLVTDLYTQNGQSRAFLNSHGYIQMVSRSSLHINRLPCENEKIFITVREEKPEGFQMMRYYKFSNENNEILIEGKSLWVIVEPSSREVISPDKFEFCIKSDKEELHSNEGYINIYEADGKEELRTSCKIYKTLDKALKEKEAHCDDEYYLKTIKISW